jgi:hypothetical protein
VLIEHYRHFFQPDQVDPRLNLYGTVYTFALARVNNFSYWQPFGVNLVHTGTYDNISDFDRRRVPDIPHLKQLITWSPQDSRGSRSLQKRPGGRVRIRDQLHLGFIFRDQNDSPTRHPRKNRRIGTHHRLNHINVTYWKKAELPTTLGHQLIPLVIHGKRAANRSFPLLVAHRNDSSASRSSLQTLFFGAGADCPK